MGPHVRGGTRVYISLRHCISAGHTVAGCDPNLTVAASTSTLLELTMYKTHSQRQRKKKIFQKLLAVSMITMWLHS